MEPRKCEFCRNAFTKMSHHAQRFCSRRCARLANPRSRPKLQPHNGKALRMVTVRMTSEQHANLCEGASGSGISLEEFVRRRLGMKTVPGK